MFSRFVKQNLDFYLNNGQIHGIQDLSASYVLPVEHTKFLGMTSSAYAPNGPQIGNLSVTTYLSVNNNFLQYTGDFGTIGYITKKNNPSSNILFGFTSGYLTNYNLSCQLGQIPTVKADFSIFDNAGAVPASGSYNTTQVPTLGNSNSISLSIGDLQTNRVLGFNFNISIPRFPIYYINNRNPAIVTPVYPVEVNGDFTIQPDSYIMQSFNNLPLNLRNNNFAITLNDFTGRQISLDFTNKLTYFINTEESFQASVNDPAAITIKYKGYFR